MDKELIEVLKGIREELIKIEEAIRDTTPMRGLNEDTNID